MPTYSLRCPDCRAVLKTSTPVAAGKKVKCPKCGSSFVPEEPDEADSPSGAIQAKAGAPEVTAVRKGRPSRDEEDDEDQPRSRKERRARDDDEDDDDRPRRSRKKKKAAPQSYALVIGLCVGAGFFVLLAGGVAVWLLMSSARAVNPPPPIAMAPVPNPVVMAAPNPGANPPAAPIANAAPPAAPVQPAANPAPPAAKPVPAVPVGGGADAMAGNVLETIRRATAYIKVDAGELSGTGSGFLMKVNGDTAYVITNHHVISPEPKEEAKQATPVGPGRGPFGPKFGLKGPRGPLGPPGFGGPGRFGPGAQPAPKVRPKVTVVLHSGTPQEQSVPAEVVAYDTEWDLAALRITGARDLPAPIDLSQEAPLAETMPLYIFGFPFGKALAVNKANPAITISKGSISSLRHDDNNELAVVQINGDINPGNSGGPVVDNQGRLVGISVAHIPGTQIGLAVPAIELNQMLKGRIYGMAVYKVRQQQTLVNINGQVWVFDRRSSVRGSQPVQVQVPGVQEKVNVADNEFNVEIRLTDPMHHLKSVVLHHVRSDAAPGKPNAQGLWDPLAGAEQTPLKIEDQRAQGTFTLPPGTKIDEQYAFQLSYINADGRTIFTQPYVARLTFPRNPEAVTLKISGIPDDATKRYILDALPKLLDGPKKSVSSTVTKDGLTVELNPVQDPQALANKITFGQVTSIDGRTINVLARKQELPPPSAEEVTTALAELNGPDRGRRKQAAERLAKVYLPLADRRAEVAKALEAQLAESDLWLRRAALSALNIWGGPENVPALTATLSNQDFFTRKAALDVLVRLKDASCAEAVAKLLPQLGDRGDASRALKAMGPAAQKAVLPYLEHNDLFTRAEACQILKDIGTAESVPALQTLVNRETNGFVKRPAEEALAAAQNRR